MILTLTNYLQVAIKENYLSVDFYFSQSGRETCVGGYKFLAALCYAHEDADMHTETGREREPALSDSGGESESVYCDKQWH